MRRGIVAISTHPVVPDPIYPSIGNLNGKTMKSFGRYSKRNNVIRELRNRHIEHEAEIAELKEMINFSIDYTSTLENTIENFDVGEYVADLGTELESRHEEYEAEIIELRDIVNFQIRNSFNNEIFYRIDTGPWPNAVRPDKSTRPEPPKREISVDYSEVERLAKESEAVRALLLADEYDDVLELEADELTGYQPISSNGKTTEVVATGNPAINGTNGVRRETAAGFLHRPEGRSDDLLMDSGSIARVIGDCSGKRAKLITIMMENGWECSAALIQRRFPGEFINPIVDEINEIALEEIDDNLMEEVDGLWIILMEYRDEIECIANALSELGHRTRKMPE